MQDPSTDFFEEFQIYVNYQDDLPNPFNIPAFWSRFLHLEHIVNKVTSIDTECSFSLYKDSLNKQLTTFTYRLIGLVGRLFANGQGHLGSIPGHVIPKTLNMVLYTSLLNTQQYKVHIKGKVE